MEELHRFGRVLIGLQEGKLFARVDWDGSGMFIYLVKGGTFEVNRPPLTNIFEPGKEVTYHAHIDMWTAQGYAVPWVASHADMLADDWVEVTNE